MSLEIVPTSNQEILEPGERTLDEIAADINAGHQQILEGLSVALQRAILIGEQLLQAREKVEPGTWGAWFDQNISFSQQASHNYMRLAEFQHLIPEEIMRPKITNGIQPGIAKALVYLQRLGVTRDGGSGRRGRRVDVDEVRRLHRQGVRKADIARLLGHSKSSITRVLLPKQTINERRRQEKKKRMAADRALRREKLAAQLAAVSDDLGETYSLLRKTMQRCQMAHDKIESKVIRQSLSAALNRLLEAEEHLNVAQRTPEETVYEKAAR